jgi:hypothetical protein
MYEVNIHTYMLKDLSILHDMHARACNNIMLDQETCGTVPNPEKSHMSRSAGHSGFFRIFLGRDKRDRDY